LSRPCYGSQIGTMTTKSPCPKSTDITSV